VQSGLTAAGIPQYYLADKGGEGTYQPDAYIVDSATGQVVVTVRPPAGYASFAVIGNAAADDRTWIVGIQRTRLAHGDNTQQPITFFLLRFDPATGRAEFRQLPTLETRVATVQVNPVELVPSTFQPVHVGDFVTPVLSPDGTRVAMLALGYAPDQHTNTWFVAVCSLRAGGTWRTWEVPAGVYPATGPALFPLTSTPALSWSPDSRTLVIASYQAAGTLDTSGPGGQLAHAVRIVPLAGQPQGSKGGFSCLYSFAAVTVTGTGTRLACIGAEIPAVAPRGVPAAAGPAEVAIYSLADGRLLSTVPVAGVSTYYGAEGGIGWWGNAWVNATGSVLITMDVTADPIFASSGASKSAQLFMVSVSGGRVRKIPMPAFEGSMPALQGAGSIGW
jgi:hypothetical protein